MAISETGTSTSNPLGEEYQVFLSFRGPDTRHGFADDVLYRDLSEARIHVFIDHEEIRPGERIGGELLRAINDSKLYIPIFSPTYASSYWCLCELAMMVEKYDSGKDENKKVILPIFYNVKPDDVKLRTLLYENEIQKLEQRMKDKKKNFSYEDANTWRQALKTVGGISGLDLKNFTSDGALSESVVKEVVNRLQTRQREVTKDLVGMKDRIVDINKLLDVDSGGVRLIGIYGMGGMGKTTLARIIYNQLCPRYGKYCSFLDDVTEMAKTKGLVELQKQLLSDIANSRVAHDIANVDEGIKAIEGTICNKKVLVVLDDVNDSNQIQKLIGRNSLYLGTRILVTTRDSRVLDIIRFKYPFKLYELEGLGDEHALQLFSKHAFDDNSPPDDYNALSIDIINTASGLPLALQAIGASLYDQKDKEIWEEKLEELRSKLFEDVLGKLKIAYDALKSTEQNIFLDIACFFINEEKTEPVFMWRDCGFSPKSAIDVLTKKCMIKVLDNNKFWMHDQFRDLGREIAEKGHTRLWDTTEIIDKLRSTKEKHSVQALCFRRQMFDPCITVTAKQIKQFPRLRFLWLANVYLQGDFAGCLSKLKWFHLAGDMHSHEDYRLSMPTNLDLQNVVVLHTSYYEWTKDAVKSLLKEARKLKVLVIYDSYRLRGTITFSEHVVLVKLDIFSCPSLKIGPSIRELKKLTYLEFEDCDALEIPKQIGKLDCLQHLSLMKCKSLKELPNSVSKLKSLTNMVLSHLSITRLPGTMSELTTLHTLDLSDCNEIEELPELPRSLTTLRLTSHSLRIVPDVSNLTNLVELLLSDRHDSYDRSGHSNIIQPCDLPWSGRLSNLRKQELCLLNVRATSVEWGSFSLLEELRLSGLDLQTLKQLPSNLRVLKLHKLPNLEELIVESEPVARISITSSLNKLRDVEVSCCDKLVEVQFLGILKSIESISFQECKSFERLVCHPLQAPESTDDRKKVFCVSSSLEMLQKLELSLCPKIQEIQFVSTLEALKEILVFCCISLNRLGGLPNLKNLNILNIQQCKNLQVVEDIGKLERLQILFILKCRSMERIIEASSSKIPMECQIYILNSGQLLDTGSRTPRITWKRYRKMILKEQTKASDSAIETIFSKRGDPLLEQQDDGDDDDDNEDYSQEDDDDEHDEDARSDEDDEDDEHEDYENGDSEDDEVDSVSSFHRPSSDSSMDNNDEDDDNDEDKNEHEVLQSSRGLLPGCSVGNNDENNEVNEEEEERDDAEAEEEVRDHNT
ncbi:hypothetical protein ACJRO7_033588 [Eucalyptus globulus]|uniref:TIR domain-containing protein n=1 Tax=Eucalyptus globulus TaxID=34317 RepID=A0ABD3JZU3_EUCGL